MDLDFLATRLLAAHSWPPAACIVRSSYETRSLAVEWRSCIFGSFLLVLFLPIQVYAFSSLDQCCRSTCYECEEQPTRRRCRLRLSRENLESLSVSFARCALPFLSRSSSLSCYALSMRNARHAHDAEDTCDIRLNVIASHLMYLTAALEPAPAYDSPLQIVVPATIHLHHRTNASALSSVRRRNGDALQSRQWHRYVPRDQRRDS